MAARELANLQHKLCPFFFTGTVKATRSPSEALRNAQTVQRYVLNDPFVIVALEPVMGVCCFDSRNLISRVAMGWRQELGCLPVV